MTTSGEQSQPTRPPGRNDLREVLTLALSHHQAGRLDDAERIYRRVLAADPAQPDALHLLGVVMMARGDHGAAHELLTAAVAAAPEMPGFHNALANANRGLGRLDDAVAAYRRALELDPKAAAVATNLAATLLEQGDLTGAAEAITQALDIDASYPDAHFVQGELHRIAGDAAAAEVSYRRALGGEGVVGPAHLQLALLLRRQGRLGEAEATLQNLVDRQPTHASGFFHLGVTRQMRGDLAGAAHAYDAAQRCGLASAELFTNLGLALQGLGRLADAETYQRRAVTAEPDAPDLQVNLAGVLRDQGRLEEAADACRRAISLRPDFAEAHALLGVLLSRLEDDAGALAALARAARLRPDSAAILNEYGNALMDAGETAQAVGAYREACRIDPSNADVRFNAALALLAAGELADGWTQYRARWSQARMSLRWTFPQPEWNGDPLPGGTLLVWREQGLGDELMFGSCLPEAAARVGQLVIACTPRLVSLFARSFPAARVIPEPELAAPHLLKIDRHLPMGELPSLVRRKLDEFPQRWAYLTADPVRVEAWRSRLAALGPGPKVGLCWRSSLLTDARRSAYAPLEAWYPVLRVPGLVFVNLQYDRCDTELEAAERALGVRVHRWTEVDLMNDLEETAALTAALDLVLSAPTAAGELAGALGVPTWRIAGGRDWTMLGSDRRPWFPAMQVCRRRRGTPWEQLLEEVADQVAERFGLGAGVTP